MTDPQAADRPSLVPIVLGFLLAGVALLALGFWAASRRAAPISESHPSVVLRLPARDTVLDGPITLEFSTSRKLTLLPTGWGTGRYHLHALAGSRELMPGPGDIVSVRANIYRWTLPPISQTVEVRLIWALPNHSRVAGGSSHAVRISPR